MSTTYTLPKTAALADKAAGSLLSEATEKEWSLAALVYAQVLPHGKRKEYLVDLPVSRQTPVQFAARGVRGLTSDKTVRNYRATWQAAVDAGLVSGDIKLGDTIKLPPTEIQIDGETVPSWDHFSPGDARDGSEERHVSKAVARERVEAAIKADPTLITDAIQADSTVAETAWRAVESRQIEKAQDAQLDAILRGGKVTTSEPKIRERIKDAIKEDPDIVYEAARESEQVRMKANRAHADHWEDKRKQRQPHITCDMGSSATPLEEALDGLISGFDTAIAAQSRHDALRLLGRIAKVFDEKAKAWRDTFGYTGTDVEIREIKEINATLRSANMLVSTFAVETPSESHLD